MRFRTLWFFALLLTVLTLGAGLAHLYAIANKMQMSRDEYLTAQKIYQGWILVALANIPAIICTVALAWKARRTPRVAGLTRFAAAASCLAFAIFMSFTFPANQATQNWTTLNSDWQHLRTQWEYSHAVNAVLYLAAFITLALAVPGDKRQNTA